MDDNQGSGTSGDVSDDAAEDAGGGGQRDELGLLISAWLFDPEISELFENQQFDAALEKTGIVGRADLVAKLQGIDPEQIKELVQRFQRPLVRPMS